MQKTIMTAAIGTLLLVGIYGGIAQARSTPAALGRSAAGSQLSCTNLDANNLRLSNACGTIVWELPLILDSNGSHSSTLTLISVNTGTTACRLIGIGRDGTGFSSPGFVHPSAPGVIVNMSLGSANAPSNGLSYIDCDMGAGDIFVKADHSPN